MREAFRILQSEGYLEVIPNKGSFVKKITPEYIHETAIIYKLLAPVVLEKAIPKYKERTYKKANEILTKIDNCKDFSQIGYLLWDFAKVIYGPSNMKFVLSLFDEMYMHGIRSLTELFEIKQHHHYNTTSHKKFLELCKKHKQKEAIEVWHKHINRVEQLSLKKV